MKDQKEQLPDILQILGTLMVEKLKIICQLRDGIKSGGFHCHSRVETFHCAI